MHGMRMAAVLVLLLALPADDPHTHHDHGAPDLGNIGKAHLETSCNEAAQKKIDRGVALIHSFWYAEAEKAFRSAAAADAGCGDGLVGRGHGQSPSDLGAAHAGRAEDRDGKRRRRRRRSARRRIARRPTSPPSPRSTPTPTPSITARACVAYEKAMAARRARPSEGPRGRDLPRARPARHGRRRTTRPTRSRRRRRRS